MHLVQDAGDDPATTHPGRRVTAGPCLGCSAGYHCHVGRDEAGALIPTPRCASCEKQIAALRAALARHPQQERCAYALCTEAAIHPDPRQRPCVDGCKPLIYCTEHEAFYRALLASPAGEASRNAPAVCGNCNQDRAGGPESCACSDEEREYWDSMVSEGEGE
jgi:hypothetical protein